MDGADRDHGGLRIAAAELLCPAELIGKQRRFYEGLGFAVRGGDAELRLPVGAAELAFTAAEGPAFHHFAFLVPSARFSAARRWAEERVALLPGAGGDPVFTFPAWNALAIYFHDPAGNIVELIAHDAAGGDGERFETAELEAISEVGLVVADPPAAAAELERAAGLELWSGGVEGPHALGFVGRRAHTLIVVPDGRGWLPTGREAEPHPVAVTVAGAELARRDVRVEAHTVSTRPR